jgi:hypothetical protein
MENGIRDDVTRACQRLGAVLSLALIPLLAACGGPPAGQEGRSGPAVTASRTAEAERRRQQEAQARLERQRRDQERCLRERPDWEAGMAALRRAESRLARVKVETYVPSLPPPPWNEAAEARYRREDREADWQRHQQAQEDWRLGEQSRRARWDAEHRWRLDDAQTQLNQEARALRERRASLFTGPTSIEFNPATVDQLLLCRTSATVPMGKTALLGAPSLASTSVTVALHSDTPP